MRYITLMICFFSMAVLPVFSAEYTSVQNGDWSDSNTWNEDPSQGCNVSGNDTFNIEHDVTVDCGTGSFKATGTEHINVKSGGRFIVRSSVGIKGNFEFTIDDGAEVFIEGDVELGGNSFTNVNGKLFIEGDAVGNGGAYEFVCDGTDGTGEVNIGGTGCNECTSGGTDNCDENVTFPLPVSMIHYNVVEQNGDIIVEWQTISELQNNYFAIEASHDLDSWETLGTVEGAGTSQEQHQYAYTLESTGYAYIRIVQYDYDGTFEVFPIKAIPVDANEFELFPTLVAEGESLHLTGPCGAVESITITSVEGRKSQPVQWESLSSDEISITLPEKQVSSVQLLKIATPTSVRTLKIMVQ